MDTKSNEKCRLCSRTTYLKNVFSCDGLQQSIKNYAHIHIDREDVLPTVICESCHGKIRHFQKFVDKAHGIQAELLKDYKCCRSGRESKSRKRSHSASEEKWKTETISEMGVIEVSTDDESSGSSSSEDSENENEDSDVEFVSIETDVTYINRCPKNTGVKSEPVSMNPDSPVSMHPDSPEPEFKPMLGPFMHEKIQVGQTLEELCRESRNTKRTNSFIQEKGTAISKDDFVNKSSQVMVVCEPKNDPPRRSRFTRHQVELMERYFPDHRNRFTVPTLLEIAEFFHEVNGEFMNVTITRVRNYFVNRKYRFRR